LQHSSIAILRTTYFWGKKRKIQHKIIVKMPVFTTRSNRNMTLASHRNFFGVTNYRVVNVG